MDSSELTRREFLRISALAPVGLWLTSFLTACGSPPPNPEELARIKALEEARKFVQEEYDLIPDDNPIINSDWYRDESQINAAVSPPKTIAKEIQQVKDPDEKIRLTLQRCALYKKQKLDSGKTQIVPSPRWNGNLNYCNLYAQAFTQLLTYGIGTGVPDLPERISHTVIRNNIGQPLSIQSPKELSEKKQQNGKNFWQLDAPMMNEWFELHGEKYGWYKVTNKSELDEALGKRHIVYGIRTFQDANPSNILYQLAHNWVLFNYKSKSLGRDCRVVTQATANHFMQWEGQVGESIKFKFDPFSYPSKESGRPQVAMWVHAIV